jgi:hypothetical protein
MFVATTANNGDKYKVVIGTTASNLANNNCSFSEGTSTVTLNVINCGSPLNTDIISFTGKKEAGVNRLQWTTGTEDGLVRYVVERSLHGGSFQAIATIKGYNNHDALNTYSFTDAGAGDKAAQYRIRLSATGREKFSRILSLSAGGTTPVQLTNPFFEQLQITFNAPQSDLLQLVLLNMNGQVVRQQQLLASAGINQLTLRNTHALPAGLYTLQVRGTILTASQRVLKQNRL